MKSVNIQYSVMQSCTVYTMLMLMQLFVAGQCSGNRLSVTVNAAVNCPSSCGCYDSLTSDSLFVNCFERQLANDSQLTEQLDSLLSSNLTYGRLTSLNIVNTPLTHVPRSVCRLTTLTQLHLDYNRLTELPDNCFTNLTKLVNFSAANNVIETIRDGLWDGLDKLYSIDLKNNRIRSIGLRVFAVSANLPSLRHINLSYNNLTSLEPWPYYRGIQGTPENPVDIDLRHNRIHQFTNEIGYEGNCRFGIPCMRLFLYNNRIRHYIDMANAWNMTIDNFAECVYLNVELYGLNRIHTWIYLLDNDFMCDCIDYHFYQALSHPAFQPVWYFFYCHYYDPESMQWSVVNPFRLADEKFVCELTERCPPGCRCAHRPANATLHLYCSNSNLTVLPLEIPELPSSETKYKLDFSRNRNLSRLSLRRYFSNTTIVDASFCGIRNVDDTELKQLLQVLEVNLDDNKIQSLPKSVSFANISTTKLSVDSNPWSCLCENRWMADWFTSISDRLSDTEIFCDSPQRQSGKNMLQIPKKEFCEDPALEAVKRVLTIVLSSVAGFVVLLLCTGIMVHRLRVRLYTRWKFHPFDRDECLEEDMDYDVFLCCSSEDHLPHGMRVWSLLESMGYRVCYHIRDFLGGETITDNICLAVQRSKRTLCLLTENFLQSGYCMEEFNISYHHNIEQNRTKRLIVLMALRNRDHFNADVSPSTLSLRHYLRQYTYIDYTADDWLDKLLYALPLRGMNDDNSGCSTSQ